uniref:Anti-silencing function protein 1 n=1 Tax=Pseudictyota dubia TaxID=2749911 RepID=A0A7R9YYF3_9STRA|mmetsp:Transcript_12471/g.23442  ORF Transcript_12471/g.23442 Transcript_12471/m.23442 type:complete len:217 (+) Transcript_12471:388-1038(+)
MALVNITNMVVLDNPTNFNNPFRFEITFECLQQLEDDIEWKVIYVGSAESSSHDQVLDEILVGPVPVGVNKFVLEADPPSLSSVPNGDILGVTVVLVTCSYKEQEFTRVGYYVNNEYTDDFDPEFGPPQPLDLSKVVRTILADKPRVTRFPIVWNKQDVAGEAQQTTEAIVTEESDSDMGLPEAMTPEQTKSVTFGPDVIVTPEVRMNDSDAMMVA